jgi:hypothetical protein
MNVQTGVSLRITEGAITIASATTTNYTAATAISWSTTVNVQTAGEQIAMPTDLALAGVGNLYFELINQDPTNITSGTIELASDSSYVYPFAKLTTNSKVALIPSWSDTPTVYARSTITGTGSYLRLQVVANSK